MIDLSPAATRLAKLIPKLGSGSDAEIAGTVRAIGATLRRHDLDFHDLAGCIAELASRPDPAGSGRTRPAKPAEYFIDRCMARQHRIRVQHELKWLWRLARQAVCRHD